MLIALHSILPAGSAFTPRDWAAEHIAVAGYTRLPQREVCNGVLGVFVCGDPFARAHCFKIQFEQLPVRAARGPVLFDAEIN